MFVMVRMQQNKVKSQITNPIVPETNRPQKENCKTAYQLQTTEIMGEIFNNIYETNNYARQQLIESVLSHSP